MKPLLSLVILIAFLQSCGKPTDSVTSGAAKGDGIPLTDSEKEFAAIVNGIPVFKLPHRFAYWLNQSPPIKDSITIKWCDKFWDEHSMNIWGRVFVEQPNIHLLATQPDDQGTAFLVTFDRSGKLMAQEALQRGHYVSADPEYATENYSTLYSDMRLVEIDSLFKYPYDSINDDRLLGDERCKVTYHEYKIAADGSFQVIRYDTTAYFKTGY